MDPLPAELSLEEFVLEMGREPVGALAHERFLELAGRLRVSDDLIESRARFPDVEYTRNLVLRTRRSSCSCCAGSPARSPRSTTTPGRSTPYVSTRAS